MIERGKGEEEREGKKERVDTEREEAVKDTPSERG